ncbi:hypothetical protein HDU93_004015 [Gonapodya sp. JEL0774]|nr:hypothetical protein HDU93_004015 [Gonapodya sp. JEL0774]
MLDRLPFEIVSAILQVGVFDVDFGLANGVLKQRDIANIALVCKNLHAAAVPILYRNPSFVLGVQRPASSITEPSEDGQISTTSPEPDIKSLKSFARALGAMSSLQLVSSLELELAFLGSCKPDTVSLPTTYENMASLLRSLRGELSNLRALSLKSPPKSARLWETPPLPLNVLEELALLKPKILSDDGELTDLSQHEHCSLSHLVIQHFAILPEFFALLPEQFPNITSLHLDASDFSLDALAGAVKKMERLTDLSLCRTKCLVHDVRARLPEVIRNLYSLQPPQLSRGFDVVDALTVEGQSVLKSLTIHHPGLDEGAIIAISKKCSNLKELHIEAGQYIGDTGILALCANPAICRTLQRLHFTEKTITTIGIQAITAGVTVRNVVGPHGGLNRKRVSVNDHQVAPVRESPMEETPTIDDMTFRTSGLRALTHLMLGDMHLGRLEVQYLGQLPKLRHLKLQNCGGVGLWDLLHLTFCAVPDITDAASANSEHVPNLSPARSLLTLNVTFTGVPRDALKPCPQCFAIIPMVTDFLETQLTPTSSFESSTESSTNQPEKTPAFRFEVSNNVKQVATLLRRGGLSNVDIQIILCDNPRLSDDDIRDVEHNFESLWETNKGFVVVFEWIEWLKEFLTKYSDAEGTAEPSVHDPQELFYGEGDGVDQAVSDIEEGNKTVELISVDDLTEDLAMSSLRIAEEADPIVFHSSKPLVDRKSVFVAHLSPVSSPAEFKNFLNHLLTDRRIARATHNISAYRIVKQVSTGSKVSKSDAPIIQQDCDDDGETAAGGRLLHLMEIVDARNVAVVVSRWYGGIQLGPDRFKHINSVARSVLDEHGFINGGKRGSGADVQGKKGQGRKKR